MKPLAQAHVTIVGTGLMGASLALALRGKVATLHGVERDPVARRIAAAFFDSMSAELGAALSADVIVLAVPVRAILQTLTFLKAYGKAGSLILDLGSSKGEIVQAMDELPEHLMAIGGHPMCGRETSGPESAERDLYQGQVFVICPSQRTTQEAFDFTQELIAAIGARAVELPAHRHDQAVAAISHLPYLLSVGLVSTVGELGDNVAWQLAAGGFRDTSRLAGSNVTMMGDTLLTNRNAVLDAVNLFRAQLNALENALRSGNDVTLKTLLERSQMARTNWHNSFHSKP